jgi:hypothetical protein
VLVLRPTKVQVENADVTYNLRNTERNLGGINNGSYFVLKNIDLKDITSITYRLASLDKDGSIEVHANTLKGEIVSKLTYQPTGAWNKFAELSAPVTNPLAGKRDLYFVFVKPATPNKNIATVDWVNFEGGREAIAKPPMALEGNTKFTPPMRKKVVPKAASPRTPVRKLPGENIKKSSAGLQNKI